MNQQILLENFFNHCNKTDISAQELANNDVFYKSEPVKELLAAMDQDHKFAEEVLVAIAKELKKMPPYRACLVSFFIGLYGERGVTSLFADRDLLDYFDLAIKFVMRFIAEMLKATGIRDLNPTVIKQFFDAIDYDKMIKQNPELIEFIQGLPVLCTAVLSRISTNRAMRSYLRNAQSLGACAAVGCVIPAARYVAAMLNITEQQQVLVLFPNSKTGFEVTVEEVDSLYVMFSLLQVALSKEGHMKKLGAPQYQYSEIIDKVLRREKTDLGSSINKLVDIAAFDYYNLHPIAKENKGKYRMDPDYLCNGNEHIETLGTLDGRLILVCDKLSKPQRWAGAHVSGMHPNLKPTLTVNRILPKEDYEKWIEAVEGIGTLKDYNRDQDDE